MYVTIFNPTSALTRALAGLKIVGGILPRENLEFQNFRNAILRHSGKRFVTFVDSFTVI